ncbi:HNH endonuclease [Specibacter sp. NPDC057265]|uniref:HNH endonuclease n=1 Tax=Specibacter sp. NPDC057265 TaxID=3346075 RepID=UPI00363B7AEB
MSWDGLVEGAGPGLLADGPGAGYAPSDAGTAGKVVGNAGAVVMEKCGSLAMLGSAVVESGMAFFDPSLLAQLDAALAHELAGRAREGAEVAEGDFAAAVGEQHAAERLLSMRERAGRARKEAGKAEELAVQATAVAMALGGIPAGCGFDAAAVEALSASALIDVVGVLEKAKNAMAAAQAQVQALFVAQQRLVQARDGVPHRKLGQGIAQQLALARCESPHRGRQLCELSEVLVREMPCSMQAFSEGRLSEYRATVMAAETVFLSRTDRARVDEDMCGPASNIESRGTGELRASVRKASYALDPESFIKRHQKAAGDRYVSLRPAADGMTFLTALIPLKQGVRILNTLTKVAASARAAGDGRGKGQVMADALMHRLIHHAPCDEGAGTLTDHRGSPAGPAARTGDAPGGAVSRASFAPPAPVAVVGGVREPWCTAVGQPEVALELVMTDRALFGNGNEPAVLVGYEALPAPLARDMILGDGAPGPGGRGGARPGRVWLKRLFTHPETNALLAMDSRARLFPEGLKEFLRIRDQRCQSPYCDAPIREYDHIKSYAAGGPTTSTNGQGLCTACNLAKEAPGWSFERDPGAGNGHPETRITTPTGHRYITTAPPLSGTERRHANRNAQRRC